MVTVLTTVAALHVGDCIGDCGKLYVGDCVDGVLRVGDCVDDVANTAWW